MRNLDIAAVKFDDRGLVPVITQDAHSKEVLMLAYANRETLLESLEIRKMVYFSRSRNQRWLKGETSGNYQDLVSLSLDCDGDTVLALVHTSGPACHNGTSTCFVED
ncbi:MAG: phosphoribosyl-AMP cyclohydrolase [Actinomycetota bacterium]|jgi:phosphoribosyl-AMP cyclohydrolase